jgi:hypothetical protein
MKQFRFLAAIPIIMAFIFMSCNNADEKKADPTAAAPDTSAAKPKETVAPTPAPLFNVAVIIHKVANYAKWLPAYESDDSARMASGLSNYVLGRGLDKDSNTVLVALKMADATKAKAMSNSPTLKEKMKQGGVIGMPTMFFEENVMMDTSTMANTVARVMVTHKVKDWDAWKKEFDSHKQTRIDAGLVDRVVGHSIDDNHLVRIVFAITDMAKAKAFMASKDLKDKMAAAGVEGPPTFFYYTIAKKY